MAILDIFNFGKNKKELEPKESRINNQTIQLSPRGTSGTQVYAGYFDEEYLQALSGKERADVFDKIRRSDAQVKMLLAAVKNPIRTCAKEIHPASDDPEHIRHAELCKKSLFENIKFNKFLNESLTLVDFGHAVFERVHCVYFKPIIDDEGNTVIEQYVGLKKLGWRSPKTIEKWNFNDEKELDSVTQFADGDLGRDVDIPAKFLSIMTLDMEGDNYEGISMLRPIYGNYFRKNEYLKLNAIGIEKSMPIPTAEVPAGQENSVQFTNLIAVLRAFTSHQQNFITYPAGWAVNLSNGTTYDPSKVEQSIDNEDKRMAKSFLANFLELGMSSSGGGAYALSNDLSDFFLSGLTCIAGIIKEAIDEIIKELVILNFGEQEKYPEIKFSGISDKAGKELAEIISMFSDKKIIVPDDMLEKHLRERLGLPKISDEGKREVASSQFNSGAATLSEKIKYAIEKRKNLLAE